MFVICWIMIMGRADSLVFPSRVRLSNVLGTGIINPWRSWRRPKLDSSSHDYRHPTGRNWRCEESALLWEDAGMISPVPRHPFPGARSQIGRFVITGEMVKVMAEPTTAPVSFGGLGIEDRGSLT
jgi:hypothetical protein